MMILGSKLKSWQNNLCSIFLELQPDETLVVKKSRQVGCSFALAQILFFVALNRPKSKSIYVTTTNSIARKFFQDMTEFCQNSSLVKCNSSLLEMSFFNGSIIYFKSSESSLRSLSCRNGGILCVDECAFLNEDIWTQILPFTTVSHANKIVCSTPWSKNNMFYTFYQRAVNGESKYKLIDTKDFDLTCFISEEQKEEYKKILTPLAYRTEILGEFLDGNSGVFKNIENCLKNPIDQNPVWIGIDFSVAVNGDDICLVGFNKNKEMCLLYYDNQIEDPIERCNKLIEIINKYPSIKEITAETNSMGSTFISLIKRNIKKNILIRNFTTTNSSKKDLIENLVKEIQQGNITLLNEKKLIYEFNIFELKELKSGNYTYGNISGINNHDDIVMATAFACHNFKNTNSGKYVLA